MGELSPPVVKGQVLMTFKDAIEELRKGKKIARESWGGRSYGLLKEGFVSLFIGGEFKTWLINDGDLEGVDWTIVKETN